MNEIPEQQAPENSQTEGKKQDYTKWIIIGVVGLVFIYGAQSLFSPERAIERAIEGASGGDVDINIDDIEDNRSMRVTGDDGGEYNISTGNDVSLPDNWPSSVSIPSSARLSYAGSMNAGDAESVGLSAIYTTKESTTEVAKYFKSTLETAGWEIQGTMATGDGSMITATKGEEENVAVYIGSTEDETTVTVSVQMPK